jgi:predicted ThiF/HesA family dinucleotide-utilizing enzyme
MSITNGYATLSDVKASLRLTDNIDDALLNTAIESASRMIDGFTARTFSNAGTAVRNFAATDEINLIIDDAITVIEVASTDEIGSTYTVWISIF